MAASAALYERYRALAEAETRLRRVYFCGRLAQYRYFNTDEVVGEALKCFQQIQRRCLPGRAERPSSPLAQTA
jgi:UDP-galactopyranose mutase